MSELKHTEILKVDALKNKDVNILFSIVKVIIKRTKTNEAWKMQEGSFYFVF